MGQKPSEGKRVHNIFQSCLIKNLARKIQWDKTIDKGKIVQRILLPPLHNMSRYFWTCKVMSRANIPKIYRHSDLITNLLNLHSNGLIIC